MTRRPWLGLLIVGLVGFALGVALTLGFQRLTGSGAPLPSTAESAPRSSPTSLVGLPRGDLTPGAINPAATQETLDTTVCMPGWATSVRPPAAYTGALKLAQILEYGYSDRNPSHYQEDHLVPLELGGASRDRRNLWPQPNTVSLPDGTSVGSKEKDDLEDVLHSKVCDGEMTLDEAQRAMASDWIAAWEAAGRP